MEEEKTNHRAAGATFHFYLLSFSQGGIGEKNGQTEQNLRGSILINISDGKTVIRWRGWD